LDLLILSYILVFAVLLGLSGFFSASEAAYFSLSSSDLERMRPKKDYGSRQVVNLLTHPKKLLITIVVGNTIVNIAAASLAAVLTLDICAFFGVDPTIGVIIDVVVVTFVILIFTEIIPKIAAVRAAKKMARHFAFPLTVFFYLFSPLVSIFYTFTQWLSSFMHVGKSKLLVSEEELLSIVDVGEEKGTLLKDEKEMIHSIFEFGETTVREIMVPRIDMICIPTDTDFDTLLDLINKHLHSRIPLFKEKVDNIIGIIFAKDLLPFATQKNADSREKINLEKLARPAYFVPEQKKIDELLREFQEQRIHMAIVVDEYGGTAGLVTLEDIIEEIVGEIQDEHDIEPPQYQKVNDNEYIVAGSMDLEELNEELRLDLPTEEGVETIGGFLFGLFGSVPKDQDSIQYQDYRFTVEKIHKRRIQNVRITKLPPVSKTE